MRGTDGQRDPGPRPCRGGRGWSWGLAGRPRRPGAAVSSPKGKTRPRGAAARDHFFVIAQLRRIIEGLSFSGDKIRAVEIVAPRILDRRNAYTLYSVFTFDSEKDQARAIFDRQR